MQALIVEFIVHAPHAEAFAAAITENARASREQEPGCRQFDVCQDPQDPRRFMLYELYDDEAAVQAHLRAPHFLAMSQRTASWVQSKTVWRQRRIAP